LEQKEEALTAEEVDEVKQSLDTVGDYIRWGASCFQQAGLHFGHGTDNAVDEAAFLVLHALHLPPDTSTALYPARLTPEEKSDVLALLKRRVDERRPAAYLAGTAWFAGLPFSVDERVLVPRSPMAEWIERQFEPWLDADSVSRVLDVGTGSGCLAIICAMAFPEAQVDAVDLSADALDVARINIDSHGLTDRVQLSRSDVFTNVHGDYDLIISNPPYVDPETIAAMPPEYQHEPEAGFAAGDDGLAVVGRILAGAAAHLRPGGLLVVEVGCGRAAFSQAYPELPVTWLEMTRGGDDVFLLHVDDLDGVIA